MRFGMELRARLHPCQNRYDHAVRDGDMGKLRSTSIDLKRRCRKG
jgi:hypothetical protein